MNPKSKNSIIEINHQIGCVYVKNYIDHDYCSTYYWMWGWKWL